jgi:predicted aspartyl protease
MSETNKVPAISNENDDSTAHLPPNNSLVMNTDEQLARDMQLALDLERAECAAQENANNNYSINQNNNEENGFLAAGYYNPHYDYLQDVMLYVNCKMDGRAAHLMVDSGASVSAMTRGMVRAMKLGHKVNANVVGTVGGVGSATIVGCVEDVTVAMGPVVEYKMYFLVVDGTLPSIVLGLDQMRRFKCLIDLDNNCIVFGGKEGISVPFLNESKAREVHRKAIERVENRAAAAVPSSDASGTNSIPDWARSLWSGKRG